MPALAVILAVCLNLGVGGNLLALPLYILDNRSSKRRWSSSAFILSMSTFVSSSYIVCSLPFLCSASALRVRLLDARDALGVFLTV